MTQIEDARASLAAMAESRQRLANAARVPMWRHLVFGGTMGGLIAAYGLPVAYQAGAVAVMIGAVAVIVRKDRERMGMFVNGYRRGRTAWVVYPLMALVLLALVLAVVLRRPYGIDWAPFAIAAVTAGVGFAASLLWERVYLRELQAQDGSR